MTPSNTPADASLAPRLQKLEESFAFSEHTIEQLAAELVEVNRRLAETVERVQRLESAEKAKKGTGADDPDGPR
jgi:uncharacterized coiled-coil protein SlyX